MRQTCEIAETSGIDEIGEIAEVLVPWAAAGAATLVAAAGTATGAAALAEALAAITCSGSA